MTGKMRSCVKGLLMGLCGKPLPLSTAKKEPVAYLYNGVRLPKLPEWDMEKYPYAVIATSNTYSLYFTDVVWYYDGSKLRGSADGNLVMYALENGEWVYVGDSGIGADEQWGDGALWANCDILDSDGTTYLAASEPVPVYE